MWLINRGGRGTCVGVTRTTVSTDRNVKTCRDVSTGDSRDKKEENKERLSSSNSIGSILTAGNWKKIKTWLK